MVSGLSAAHLQDRLYSHRVARRYRAKRTVQAKDSMLGMESVFLYKRGVMNGIIEKAR